MAAVPSIGRASRVEPGAAPGAEATSELYERYSHQVFGYCLHHLGSREEAEDAVQTTFMNAFRGLGRGIVPECEQAWLFKIAAQRLPVAPALLVASRPRRGAEQPRDAPGGHPGEREDRRRADPPPGRARGHAGEPASRDPPARVAGPVLPRGSPRAGRLSGSRRDTDLPGPPFARHRARGSPGRRLAAEARAPRRRRRRRGCLPQDAARRRRRGSRQGRRRGRPRGCGGRDRDRGWHAPPERRAPAGCRAGDGRAPVAHDGAGDRRRVAVHCEAVGFGGARARRLGSARVARSRAVATGARADRAALGCEAADGRDQPSTTRPRVPPPRSGRRRPRPPSPRRPAGRRLRRRIRTRPIRPPRTARKARRRARTRARPRRRRSLPSPQTTHTPVVATAPSREVRPRPIRRPRPATPATGRRGRPTPTRTRTATGTARRRLRPARAATRRATLRTESRHLRPDARRRRRS